MIDKWYRYWYKAYLFLKLRVRPFQSHCFEDVFPLPIVSWRGIGLLVSYGEVCFLTARSQWDIGANLQVHNFWDFQPISISTWHLHFKIFGALLTWKLDGICGVFFHTCHLKTWPPRPLGPVPFQPVRRLAWLWGSFCICAPNPPVADVEGNATGMKVGCCDGLLLTQMSVCVRLGGRYSHFQQPFSNN